jgi:hypothetical protein
MTSQGLRGCRAAIDEVVPFIVAESTEKNNLRGRLENGPQSPHQPRLVDF